MHDRIDHSIAMAVRSKKKLAIMFLDLNRFKAVNDRLGHDMGDKLLKQVSDRLTSMLRETDTVCRNGGDEFIILMECISHNEELIKLTKHMINELSRLFLIDKQEVNIGVSIGIAIYPDNGTSHTELIKNADTAMYQAKEANTTGYQFYANNMSTEMMERLEIEAQLHSALENKEFYLVYQPKVDLHSRQTIGFEALLRWQNPKFGFVSPATFIPVLERSGLINEVGLWTIHEVVEQIKNNCFKELMISINLSPLQFRNPHFFEEIKAELKNNQISPSQIEFEVTESLMMDNFESSKEKLQQLHHLDCSIALDDFGTGYSSLSYLTQLPIDVLKVDRSFITNIDQYPQQQAMLESILFMTKKLQVTTIIEGVETDEELNEIKQLGGSIIQGYYFSKPLKDNEISNWLKI
ncbi:MAG: EAL domain-containing protein [Gammaproteobacteria bacterium]|nr:EAL domain-containing protein [Gammaproteobacteria bacterium]